MADNKTIDKFNQLKSELKKLKKVVVAFSYGVDSTFLLHTAYSVLGENVLAVTADSETLARRELSGAKAFCDRHNIPLKLVNSKEVDQPEFIKNDTDRCYYCKKELFTILSDIAGEYKAENVIEGSNADDVGDYRPGMKAIKELGILSPLKDAGLTKNEIRELSKEAGLETWNKQAMACLSSRFPYGTSIDKKTLQKIEECEDFLYENDFKIFRVRHYGDTARIEISEDELHKAVDLRDEIVNKFKENGYAFVTLDLSGFKSGSLNYKIKKK